MEKEHLQFLNELKNFLLLKKRFKVFLLLIILGLSILYSSTNPTEFVAKSKLIIETGNQNELGSIGSISGLARLSNSTNPDKQFKVELYEEILKTYGFNRKLIETKVPYNGSKITLGDYLNNELKTNVISSSLRKLRHAFFLRKKSSLISSDSSKSIPKNAFNLQKIPRNHSSSISKLSKRLIINVDKEIGIVEISCQLQDPIISALAVKKTEQYLIKYVQEYEKKYEEKKLIFLNSQLETKRLDYENALHKYSDYIDKHNGVVKQKGDVKLTRLTNEMESTYTLFSTLLNQHEEALIKLAEEKTIFTELQDVVIPSGPITKGRLSTMIIFNILGFIILLGFFIGVFIIKKSLI